MTSSASRWRDMTSGRCAISIYLLKSFLRLCELHLNMRQSANSIRIARAAPKNSPPNSGKPTGMVQQTSGANCFLIYRDWLWLVKHPSYTPEPSAMTMPPTTMIAAKLSSSGNVCGTTREAKYEPTLAGWKKYLREVCPHFYEFLCRAGAAQNSRKRQSRTHVSVRATWLGENRTCENPHSLLHGQSP